MIQSVDREQFVKVLRTHLSPSAPIQSPEHLFGRAKQVQQIEQALEAEGRSIFIYGDRGVGKTSLAQTVAYMKQSVNHEPIQLACSRHTTFAGLMADAVAALQGHKTIGGTTTRRGKLGWKGIGAEYEQSHTEGVASKVPGIVWDLNSIVAALLEIASHRKGENTVVIVDEFDQLESDDERARFADFLKQLGDQRVPIRFVFCGVADSIQKLLGSHASAYRYLLEVKLATLSWDARYEIIDAAANALGVAVDDHPRFRIAAISDGFPHYVHRMCEELFWQMFNDPVPCTAPTLDHYREAVVGSVLGMEQQLRTTYEQAVMKDAPGYEQVLWAVADHADFTRNTESIHDSYTRIMNAAEDGTVVLDRDAVVSRLNSLKGASCGHILSSPKRGWYQFRENIMRGYVRLRAEEMECPLALDYAAASSSSFVTWRPRGGRRSRMGPTRKQWESTEKPSGY